MTNHEIKINFWIELWNDLIENFLKKSYGLTLYSPHILIEDIIVEIEENHFGNKENKKYFYSRIKEYLEKDEVIKTHLKSEFILLQKNFNLIRPGYILTLCKKINKSFKKGIYFKETLNLAENIILEDSILDISFVKKINYFSQSLIVELIRKSYDLEDIKKFLSNIFDSYYYHNGTLITDFPHDVNYEDFKESSGEINIQKANEKITNILDNISVTDRIKKLSYYYNKKPEKVKYIFFINGIKGDIEKSVFGVTFYSLSKRRFLKDHRSVDFEDLQRYFGEKKYLQAVVEVDYLLPKSSLKIAKSKIENALDVLACYLNFKTEVSINDSHFIIVDNTGSLVYAGNSRGKNDDFMNFHNALNLNEHEKQIDDLDPHDFLWKEGNKIDTIAKIKNALHWYRKGEQSFKDADKMLNYWIAIETLFNFKEDVKGNIFTDAKKNKINLIQEIIASEEIFKFIYAYGWELFYYFRNKIDFAFGKTDIPDPLIEQGQLNPKIGAVIYLEKFIKVLPELRKYEKNLFVLEKIDAVINFYSDSKFTKNEILNHIRQVQNDVLMIYRFRNLIVHNAHFDNTLLPYFIWKTRSYCGGVIRKFISEYHKGIKLSEILFNIYIEKEKFLLDFEKGNIDLFEPNN